jgi:hypothetical protein
VMRAKDSMVKLVEQLVYELYGLTDDEIEGQNTAMWVGQKARISLASFCWETPNG